MERQGGGPNLRPYAFVLTGVMVGGLSPVFTKLLLLDNVAGETIVAARYLVAVLLLLPIGIPHHRRAEGPAPDRRAWLTLILVGVFGSGLGALLFTAALDMSSAGVVNAISKTAPIFVALFAYFTLRERVTYLRLLLVAVMVCADMLIAAGELTFGGQLVSTRLMGDALALGAGMTRAAAEILGKSALRRFRPTTVALWRFGVGMVVGAAVSAGTGGWATLGGLGLRGWAILIALGGISTALSMTLYYRGLADIPAHIAVSLKLLGAIVTVVVSWVVLGEALTPYHIAGMGVLVSGAYLLVMRASHPHPELVLPSRVAARPWAGIRARLITLTVALVVGSVGVVWYLSVRHSARLLQQQVELTIGEIGAILADFGALDERPSWQSYQQYIGRVVGQRIEAESYSLQIVYVAVLDERGNLGAFAVSDELRLVDKQGNRLPRGDRAAEESFLQAMDAGQARRLGLITVTVERLRAGRRVGTIKLGATRDLARDIVGEVVGRSAVAALTVLLLAIAVAVVAGGSLVEPIERLAAEVGRAGRSRRVQPRGWDEVGEIRQGVGLVVEQLMGEKGTVAALRSALAQQLLEDAGGPDEPPGPRVALVVDAGPLVREGPTADLEALIETTAREVMANGGRLRRAMGTNLVATWGDAGFEQDDPLRAAVAGLAVGERLGGIAQRHRVVIGLGAGDSAIQAVEAALTVRAQQPPGEVGFCLISAPEVVAEASEHLQFEPAGEGAGVMWVTGLAPEGPAEDLAAEPEELV